MKLDFFLLQKVKLVHLPFSWLKEDSQVLPVVNSALSLLYNLVPFDSLDIVDLSL